MTLCEELYFEIKLVGPKSEIRKFASFLKSGELDEFFEISSEYIYFDDNYSIVDDDTRCSMIFSNDDYGIEIEELDTDEFLEVFCKAARKLDVYGTLFDSDDDEFQFTSAVGDSYYINSRKRMLVGDELDEVARGEEDDEQ